MWQDLKVYIRENVKPTTQDELIEGMLNFWDTVVTIDYCNKTIDHLEKVLKTCVELTGQAVGL